MRARQVRTRVRVASWAISDKPVGVETEWTRRVGSAMTLNDAAERLRELLDLADELRPLLPSPVAAACLPAFEGWRP